ncbi:uncharacterized protein [Prorops nasuta]|uniref:uncharacterized protein isoform X1 n=1 Tax=Prorops nasuta TaxID=863751 RepID=UPI0034CF4548
MTDLASLKTVIKEMISAEDGHVPRPCNLEELVQQQSLKLDSTHSTFNLEELSDNEEFWLMDIPKTVDPKQLKEQSIALGSKSKFKVKDEKYYTANCSNKFNITCIFKTGKREPRFKTGKVFFICSLKDLSNIVYLVLVNIKPEGSIVLRKKLSNMPKVKPTSVISASVPFPQNLKPRHPLFGVVYDDIVKVKGQN